MFLDYYSILGINVDASNDEIRAAFKVQALKWHPDRNPEKDTTAIMQKINEAYLILKDSEARQRYNIEYWQFKNYKQQSTYSNSESKSSNDDSQFNQTDYEIKDETLRKWMENARKQAVNLAQKTIEDFKGISTSTAKAVTKEVVTGTGCYIIFSAIVFGIIAIFKNCNG